MSSGIESKRWRDLLTVMSELTGLYDQWLDVIRQRVDAMKQADAAAMQTQNEREAVLVVRIRDRQGFHRQWLAAVAPRVGLSKQAARSLTMSQLMTWAPVAQRAALSAATKTLRTAMERAAVAHQTASRISGAMLRHLTWVFAAVAPRDAKPAAYSPRGSTRALDVRLFETVG